MRAKGLFWTIIFGIASTFILSLMLGMNPFDPNVWVPVPTSQDFQSLNGEYVPNEQDLADVQDQIDSLSGLNSQG